MHKSLSFTVHTVINLEENHKQGEDKAYADLLNRVREGLHRRMMKR